MELAADRDLYERALALPPAERDGFLARECADDARRARVRRLLDARASLDSRADFLAGAPRPPASDTSVGPYRLIELLGSGGMGEVYLAEQYEPVQRRVAVKLLRPELAGPDVLARFALERRALELLEHPNVARILDAGTTAVGRPYVVVEYVPGAPLTDYCDREALSLDRRLDLFLEVCAGVAHAHQRGIIHRDLKPSNVLVTEVDGRPVPKIIDFGIAKAVGAGKARAYTVVGTLVGTPDYMSPEQVELSSLEVDTRADVYALGALLAQLVSGELPYSRTDTAGGVLQIARGIAAREPARPSERLRRDPERLAAAARARGLAPRELQRALAGDLDWIVLKALERDRRRRYGSVGELAADLRRYRRAEPVEARSHDTAYLAARFVRRHRLAVALTGSAVMALAAFGAVVAGQAREIARERDRATAEADTARQVSGFLIDTLKSADPERHLGRPPSARQLLDDAATRLDDALPSRPAAKAEIAMALGHVYFTLGEYGIARDQFARAEALLVAQPASDLRARLDAHRNVGRARAQLTQLSAAERIALDVLTRAKESFGAEDRLVLDATHDLGVVRHQQGRHAEALALYRAAADGRERVLGAHDPATITARTNVGVIEQLMGQAEDAERTYKAAIDRAARQGAGSPQVLIARFNLSTLYSSLGDYERALAEQRALVPEMERVYGREHRYTITAAGNLAATLTNLGRHAEAERINARLVESAERRYGAAHPLTLYTRTNLAYDRGMQGGDGAALRAELTDVLRKQRETLGPQHRDVVATLVTLALLERRDRRYGDAERTLLEALDVARTATGPTHRRTGEVMLLLADIALTRGDDAAAARWLRDVRTTALDLDGPLALYPEVARRRDAGTLPG